VGDQRNSGNGVLRADEPHGAFNLLADLSSLTAPWILLRRLAHFGVSVRIAKAVKIQTPNVEAYIAEFIAPGASIKAMSNRQGGWK